jgi:hypothetical protein
MNIFHIHQVYKLLFPSEIYSSRPLPSLSRVNQSPIHPSIQSLLCPNIPQPALLLLSKITRRLLEAIITLLVRAASAKAKPDKRRPCAAPKHEHGKDDAETESDGRLDNEVG